MSLFGTGQSRQGNPTSAYNVLPILPACSASCDVSSDFILLPSILSTHKILPSHWSFSFLLMRATRFTVYKRLISQHYSDRFWRLRCGIGNRDQYSVYYNAQYYSFNQESTGTHNTSISHQYTQMAWERKPVFLFLNYQCWAGPCNS